MKRGLAVVLALLVVGATVATPVTAASGSSSPIFGPSVSEDMGLLGWSPSNDVVRYGAGQYPGWIVEYEDGRASDLQAWAESSDERTIRSQDTDGNAMLISAPPSDVITTSLLGSDSLRELSYVKHIGVNRKVGVDPLRPGDLKNSETWDKPSGHDFATFWGHSGALEADGAAWKSEINRSGLDDVRQSVDVDEVTETGAGVRYGILDTGLDYKDRLYGARVVAGKNTITNETLNITDPANATASDYEPVADGSDSNHGSWIATMIAGNGSRTNATGIAPDAELVPVKVLGDDGSGSTQDIAEGLEFACAEANVDIVHMSLGSPTPSERIEAEITECLEEEDVSAIVVAAGNSRLTYRYLASPGDAEGVVTVAATDTKALNNSESAYFSNVGPDPQTDKNPTVGTPGMQITAEVADGNVTLSGTSMAAPVTSGLLGLTLEAQPSLEGQPAELRQYLQDHSEGLAEAGETEVGAGRPSAKLLVDDVEPNQTQEEARNDDSKNRDKGNRAISGSFWAGFWG